MFNIGCIFFLYLYLGYRYYIKNDYICQVCALLLILVLKNYFVAKIFSWASNSELGTPVALEGEVEATSWHCWRTLLLDAVQLAALFQYADWLALLCSL